MLFESGDLGLCFLQFGFRLLQVVFGCLQVVIGGWSWASQLALKRLMSATRNSSLATRFKPAGWRQRESKSHVGSLIILKKSGTPSTEAWRMMGGAAHSNTSLSNHSLILPSDHSICTQQGTYDKRQPGQSTMPSSECPVPRNGRVANGSPVSADRTHLPLIWITGIRECRGALRVFTQLFLPGDDALVVEMQDALLLRILHVVGLVTVDPRGQPPTPHTSTHHGDGHTLIHWKSQSNPA